MSFDVHAFDDPAPFIQRAEPWLLRAEAENNLLLGIAARLTKSTEGYEAPITLYTIEENGETAGCAWRTPPWGLGVTRMPQAAIPALVEEVAAVYTTIPTVMGPVPTAGSVAEHWSRRKGTSFREEMRQRIYQLNRVTWPKPLASGSLRLVEPAEIDFVTDWGEAFSREIGATVDTNIRRTVKRQILERAMVLWEDGKTVSMASRVGISPNGVRIGFVYTPPVHRGRGYASACVAALSQRVLEQGTSFCFLYTDLANRTSNSLYRRLGYEPVTDSAVYRMHG